MADMAQQAQSFSASGGTIPKRKCGTYFCQYNQYRCNQGWIEVAEDGPQNELKDLAAINSMLDRIDEARSQIRFVSDASHELRTPLR